MQLKKTKMCKFHLKGICARGSECPFAHGKVELQPLPDFSQTKLCRNLMKTGGCNDPNCTYAHDVGDLRQNYYFYKTKICRYWLAGQCNNSMTCYFAHSEKELRKAGFCDETGSTSASSDDQKESMDYTTEEESVTSDQPKMIASQFNDMDGSSVDSEPSIAELVSEWCLQEGPGDSRDSDSKLDSLLSMFPYGISENISPPGSQESTVTSQESMNLHESAVSRSNNLSKTEKKEPRISWSNSFPKPEEKEKDASWSNSSLFFNDFGEAPTTQVEKDALWTNSVLQLNTAIGKALTKVDVVTSTHQPLNGRSDEGTDSLISNHLKADSVEFLPPGLDCFSNKPGDSTFQDSEALLSQLIQLLGHHKLHDFEAAEQHQSPEQVPTRAW